jgi:hypothetical protein
MTVRAAAAVQPAVPGVPVLRLRLFSIIGGVSVRPR